MPREMNRHSARASTRDAADRKSDKRSLILEAAVRVFAERGFYNARVSDIADAAGVADGTIYLYFKSKDDLLISLFELHAGRLIAKLRRMLDEEEERGGSSEAKLK